MAELKVYRTRKRCLVLSEVAEQVKWGKKSSEAGKCAGNFPEGAYKSQQQIS
jgi:hypothetical protein